MKRAVSVLLIICMAFCAGCGEANPTVDVEAQLLEADRLFFEGNYEEVILTLETVLEVEPATVRGYLRLSDAYIARGEEDKALELLQRGLEITGDEEIAARIKGMTEDITGVVDVVAAPFNTYLINDVGEVYLVGQRSELDRGNYFYNYYYELSPKKIEGLQNINTIISSDMGGYAISNDNKLYAWDLTSEDLFNGLGMSDMAVKVMDGVKDVISDSNTPTLILHEDGKLYSKGVNFDGLLGTGDYYNDQYEGDGTEYFSQDIYYQENWTLVMENVREIMHTRPTFVRNGELRSCCWAITEDNKLYGWGYFGDEENENGVMERVSYNTPQYIMDNVSMIGVTVDKLFVLTTDGNVKAIPIESAAAGGPVENMAFPNKIASISCGGLHIMAVDTAGILYTAGVNSEGQLGITEEIHWGYEIDYSTLYTPLGDTRVKEISAGSSHSCAVLTGGTLLTWGSNECGQLGNGRMGKQHSGESPTKVLSNIEKVFQVGPGIFAVSKDGIVYREENSSFEPADDLKGLVYAYSFGFIDDRGDFSYLHWADYTKSHKLAENAVYAAGNGIQLFYIDKENTLWGKGDNESGSLGIGVRNDPLKEGDGGTDEYVPIMSNVKKVIEKSNLGYELNGYTTFILTNDGDVYYCGAGLKDFVLTPQKLFSGMKDIGGTHGTLYLLDENDTMYLWAYVLGMCLEDGETVHSTYKEPIPVMENVAKFVGHDGNHSGMILNASGQVYIFGSEVYADRSMLEEMPWLTEAETYNGNLYCLQVTLPAKAVDISISGYGDSSYYVVLENGDLYAWGDNQSGQLGLGDAGSDENIFEVKLPQ